MSTDIKLNQRKRASLQQATVILSLGIAIIFLVALLTYDMNDPGPFRSNSAHDGECFNKAGCKGAWVADLLYGLLGYFAFAVPIMFVVMGLTAFQKPKAKTTNSPPMGGINTAVTVIGALMTLLAGSGLAHILLDPYPAGIGGGAMGSVVAKLMLGSVLGFYGTLLALISLFLGGVTLVADLNWIELAEKVGDMIWGAFEKLQESAAQRAEHSEKTAYLSKSKELLNTSRQSVNKISELLHKVRDLAGSSNPLDRKKSPLEEDVYQQGDPLFESSAKQPGKVRRATNTKNTASPYLAEPDDIDYEGEDKSSADAAGEAPVKSAAVARGKAAEQPQHPEYTAHDEGSIEERKPASDSIVEDRAAPASDNSATAKAKRQKTAREKLTGLLPGKLSGEQSKEGLFVMPYLSILNEPPPPKERVTQTRESLDSLSAILIESLGHYGVKGAEVVARTPGPIITRFEIQLPDGTKASKISGLANDLARNMCVSSVRVVEVIPGRPTIGVEIPNEKRDIVTISEILESKAFRKSSSPLTLVLGKDISGEPVTADLAKMPHLLVAGTTGSGKSVAVNAMLMSLLYKATPDELRLILIDPKMLELSSYEHIPHLLAPVVTDMGEAASALRWCVAEMERRYLLMSKLKVRNVAGFNTKVRDAQDRGEDIPDPLFDPNTSMNMQPDVLQPLPYIVIVIDEFADMMMIVGKKVEELIARLAQKARASGIHLVLATQRPSVDVITGLIKANIPTRIAFQVSTKIDSRTILDQGGAEQLLGYGDMLYLPPGTSMPQRVHGALVTDQEVEDVANHLKQQGEPEYIEGVISSAEGVSDAIPGLEPLDAGEEADPLYDEAVHVVTESRRASISYLQRRLKVGYNRAARMIEDMEIAGVVSAVQANGTREVLAPPPVAD